MIDTSLTPLLLQAAAVMVFALARHTARRRGEV